MKNMKFLKQKKHFRAYLLAAFAVVIIAAAAPLIAPYDPVEAVLQDALQKPSFHHLFGTDFLGRDVFSRVIYGTRTSLSSTLMLVAVVFLLGTFLGCIAGYLGGAVDAVIMRVADTMIAFPDLILAIAIAGILGPNMVNAVIAIAAVSWTKYARMARSLVLKIKNREFMAAARITGAGHRRVLAKYLLPNVLPTMIITATTDIGTIMLALASLSFLGFGIQPPTPEWGYMLSEGRNYIQTAPWLLFGPGIGIFAVVSIFNLLGDGVRDLLDPAMK